MRKPLVYVILGFAAGIAFVIACGTSGGLTDAGADSPPACNCPTPRSFGSRLRRFTVSDTMTPSDTEKVVFVSCDGRTQNPRAIAIGGGCDTLDTGVALTESSNGNSETKWSCTWRNLLGGGATSTSASFAFSLTTRPTTRDREPEPWRQRPKTMTETLSPDHPVRTLLVALEGDVPDHAVCAVRELVADLQAQDTWTVAPPSFVEGLDAVVELDGEEIGAILQGRPTQGITDGLVGEWERILGLRFSPRSPD